jgi:hypothetical protein
MELKDSPAEAEYPRSSAAGSSPDAPPAASPRSSASTAPSSTLLAGEDSRFITGQTIYVNGGSSKG